MSLLEQIHGGYVYNRRVRVLSEQLAPLLPPNSCVLDVGCGDGLISRLIMDQRPDVEIRGIDILIRPQTHIPVQPFNGETIPKVTRALTRCCLWTCCITRAIPKSCSAKLPEWHVSVSSLRTTTATAFWPGRRFGSWIGWATPGTAWCFPITTGRHAAGPRHLHPLALCRYR